MLLPYIQPEVLSIHVQGKASCMPALALNPRKGWKVLDCCAAPGNKTSHLAALVGVKGTVIACEKDPRRFATLKQTLERCKASNVQPVLGVRVSFHTSFRTSSFPCMPPAQLYLPIAGSSCLFTMQRHEQSTRKQPELQYIMSS
jgi:hypothetical protein